MPHPNAWPEAQSRADEIMAAWDGWMAAHEHARAELGLPELLAMLDPLTEEIYALGDRMLEAEATTYRGLAVQAKVWDAIFCNEDEIAFQVARGVMRLAQSGSSA